MVILASRSPDTSGILLQYVIFPFAPALSLIQRSLPQIAPPLVQLGEMIAIGLSNPLIL